MKSEELLRDETLDETLQAVFERVPGLLGVVLTDRQGLPLSGSLLVRRGVAEASTLAAVATDLATRMGTHLGAGGFETLTLAYADAYLHLCPVAKNRLRLLVLADRGVDRDLLDGAVGEVRRGIERLVGDVVFF